MTGAQEQAVRRLRKKHSSVAVNSTARPDQPVIASWDERSDVTGEHRRVIVTISPEGRVVERPS